MILPPVKWANRGANFVHETPSNRGAGLSLPITGFLNADQARRLDPPRGMNGCNREIVYPNLGPY